MSKTSAALAELSDHAIPYISVLTDPTMGGVSASLAVLGDINIAEPNALIGFAGPRVIEQTVREKLPEGFQRSEFLQEHGAIDISNPDWFDNLPIGSLVRVLPNHSCLTCAGHSSYNILENNMIIDNWKRTNGW